MNTVTIDEIFMRLEIREGSGLSDEQHAEMDTLGFDFAAAFERERMNAVEFHDAIFMNVKREKGSVPNGAQLREETPGDFRGFPLLLREGETRILRRGRVRY